MQDDPLIRFGTSLTWTHEKPKEPGWYRYRYPDGRVLVLHLTSVSEGAFFEGLTKTAWPWDYYPGEWFGPVEPPRPKQEQGGPHGKDYSV